MNTKADLLERNDKRRKKAMKISFALSVRECEKLKAGTEALLEENAADSGKSGNGIF